MTSSRSRESNGSRSRGPSAQRSRAESAESGLTEVDALLAELSQQFELDLALGTTTSTLAAVPPAACTQRPGPRTPRGSAPVGSGSAKIVKPPPQPPPQPHCGSATAPLKSGPRPAELAVADGLRSRPPSSQSWPSGQSCRRANPATPLPSLAPHTAAVAAAQAATVAATAPAAPAELSASRQNCAGFSIGSDAIGTREASPEVDVEAEVRRIRQEIEAEREQYIAERLGHAGPGVSRSPRWWVAARLADSTSIACAMSETSNTAPEVAVEEVPSTGELREQIQRERERFLDRGRCEH